MHWQVSGLALRLSGHAALQVFSDGLNVHGTSTHLSEAPIQQETFVSSQLDLLPIYKIIKSIQWYFDCSNNDNQTTYKKD